MRLHLTVGDQINWAIDEDRAQVMAALDGLCTFTDIESADAVLAFWWAPLLDYDVEVIGEKPVMCLMHGDLDRFMAMPKHRTFFDRIGVWGVRSKRVERRLTALGYSTHFIPYVANTASFHPVEVGSRDLEVMRARLGDPDGKYLVASFGRDSEGDDVARPKLVKGPDMFAEIMAAARARGLPVEAVLAGPRRHWLRDRLSELDVPCRFIGTPTPGDDMGVNPLSRHELNLLYNLVDLTVCSSRSEGGPMAALEAPASGCKMISTPVGMAPMVLPETAIFRTVEEAVSLIADDISKGVLEEALTQSQTTILRNNSLVTLRDSMTSGLALLREAHCWEKPKASTTRRSSSLFGRTLRKIRKRFFFQSAKAEPGRIQIVCTDAALKGVYPPILLQRLVRSLGHDCRTTSLWQADGDLTFLYASGCLSGQTKPSDTGPFVILLDSLEMTEVARAEVFSEMMALKQFRGIVAPSESAFLDLKRAGAGIAQPMLVPVLINSDVFGSRCINDAQASRSRASPGRGPHRRAIYWAGRGDMTWERQIAAVCEKLNVTIAALPATESLILNQSFDSLCEDDQARADALLSSDVYIETATDRSALKRLRESMLCKVPALYPMNADFESTVRFGGHAYENVDGEGLQPALSLVLENHASYRSLIRLDSDQQSVWKTLIGELTGKLGR